MHSCNKNKLSNWTPTEMLFKFYSSYPGHTDQSDFTIEVKADDIIDFISVV